jgi:hypothetical protein
MIYDRAHTGTHTRQRELLEELRDEIARESRFFEEGDDEAVLIVSVALTMMTIPQCCSAHHDDQTYENWQSNLDRRWC